MATRLLYYLLFPADRKANGKLRRVLLCCCVAHQRAMTTRSDTAAASESVVLSSSRNIECSLTVLYSN
jgi:hypothetical protein